MKFLQRYPPLAILLGAWSFPLLLSVVATPALEDSISVYTYLIIAACIVAAAAGILLSPGGETSRSLPFKDGIVLKLGVAGALAGLLHWKLRGDSGMSLEETRIAHLAGQLGASVFESYLYQAGGACSFFSIALATMSARPIRVTALALGLSILGWIGLVINTGARVVVMAMLAVAIVGLVIRFPRIVISWRGVASAIAGFIPLFAINLLFVQRRMETLFANSDWGLHRAEKASSLLGGAGSSLLANDYLVSAVWLLLQFTSDPIYYLDYFLKYSSVSPHFGLYQFGLIANRIPGFDWYGRRLELDLLYEGIGISWNVWGTAIRDCIVDFGLVGAVTFFFVVGYSAGRLRHARSVSGQLLYIFVVLWLMYTPFHSPLTTRPLQLAILITIGWYLWTVFFGEGRGSLTVQPLKSAKVK